MQAVYITNADACSWKVLLQATTQNKRVWFLFLLHPVLCLSPLLACALPSFPTCLQELPDTLCGLQLVLLDLTNNSLRRLPPALGTMTSLRSMPLDGNALKLMRRELWSGWCY